MRALILCIAILVGGCATNYQDKRAEFIAECVQITSYIDCAYTEYNTTVTSITKSVTKKHSEGSISDKTKDSYKEKITDLNKKVDDAYSLKDVNTIRNNRDVLDVLREYLEANIDPSEKVQL